MIKENSYIGISDDGNRLKTRRVLSIIGKKELYPIIREVGKMREDDMMDKDYDYELEEFDEERETKTGKGPVFLTKGTKYILMGILVVLLIGVISMLPKLPKPKQRTETQMVEVYLARKEIVQIDGEDVYLLHTEDRDGNEVTYEVSQNALGDRFDAKEVYMQIAKKKYYQLWVGKPEDYDCHYPYISGAATIIDGFSEKKTEAE